MLATLKGWCVGIVLLSAAGVGMASGNGTADIETMPTPEWATPQAPLPEAREVRYRNGPLAYLVHDTQIFVKGTATERYEYHAYRINLPAALTTVGTISIPYAAAFQRAAIHMLRIRREGKVIELLDKTAFRVVSHESAFPQGMLVGNITAIAQVPDLRVGDTLEYSYTISGNNPVFGDRAAFIVVWNSIAPQAMRRVRIVEPTAGLQARVVSPLGAEAMDLRRIDTTLGRETIVEGRDLPIAHLEPSMPTGLDPFIMLAFTPFSSWQEVGKWGNALFHAEATPSAAYIELLAHLKIMPSKHAAVAEAVRFVQDDIRYFSTSIGENSHRPFPPSEVLARRYGDCKDKSLLLSSLLRSLGVDARPALVSTRRMDRIVRFPPIPNVFDHVVTNFRFEGKDYWIDATRNSKGLAFDKAGIALAGARALPIDSSEAALVEIPDGGASRVEIVETAEVRSPDAAVAFRIDSRLTGAIAELMRDVETQRGKEASARAYREAFARRYTGTKETAPPQVRDEPGSGALLLSESYEIGQFFRTEGLDKKLALLGAQQLIARLDVKTQRERIYPFAIPGGRGSFRYEATVIFPNTIVGHEDPISNVVAGEYFRLAATRSFRGNVMRFSADLTITKSEVAPEDFVAYLDKVKHAREALLDFVLLSAENLTAESAAQPKRVAERIKEQNWAIAEGITKAIDSGRLGDGDTAEAYAKRAIARIVLRDSKGAMADLNTTLRLRPFSGQALSDRALIHMRAGRLSAAEEDLTKAIMLGAEASSAYLRRGHVRFLTERYTEALSDFQQADKSSALGINRDFIAIWQALAMRALGRDPKPALGAGLSADSKQRWPVSILALMMNEASIADVLRTADSRSTDEREANLCEANFFIGQYLLLMGDRRQAIENLRAALATGVDWFMEYDLAHVTLDRIGEGPEDR
ncbi:MAG: DUF3857 domain-containing protein [Rhodocyclaceae bacterium]|nr:DUF3857 domain-containing protein [Rhodocyclaceae bacterium]